MPCFRLTIYWTSEESQLHFTITAALTRILESTWYYRISWTKFILEFKPIQQVNTFTAIPTSATLGHPTKTKAQLRLFSYFILFLEACDQQVTCAASWRINITSEQLQDSQTTGLSAHLTVFLSSSHQTHIIAKSLWNFLLQYWVQPSFNVQPHSRRKDLLIMKLSVWTMSHWFQLHFLPRPC